MIDSDRWRKHKENKYESTKQVKGPDTFFSNDRSWPGPVIRFTEIHAWWTTATWLKAGPLTAYQE